ncbi:MAG: hypothetical protein P8171_16050 [Candidatus Thiodiazotropha sp.]
MSLFCPNPPQARFDRGERLVEVDLRHPVQVMPNHARLALEKRLVGGFTGLQVEITAEERGLGDIDRRQ